MGDGLKKTNVTSYISLKEYIWHGFNYTVGISFIGMLAILSNIDEKDSIGLNVLWIFFVEGIIVGICAWCFSKLIKIFKMSGNGGPYIFVRGGLGNFLGTMVAFLTNVMLPIITVFQVTMMIKGEFGMSFVTLKNADGTWATPPWYSVNWGSFTDLFLDLIGIGAMVIASCTVLFGLKFYKKIVSYIGYFKWSAASLLILAGVVLACQHGNDNIHYWSKNTGINLNGVIKSFNTCFYFFTGFEIFTTANKTVENPKKNMGKAIIYIIAAATIFFVVISFVFFCAVNSFSQNMSIGIWDKFGSGVIRYGAPIIMISSIVATYLNSVIQKSLYGGSSLEPLCAEGFFPKKYSERNKEGIPVKASIISNIFTFVIVSALLLIPDLIKGIQLTSKHGFYASNNDILNYKDAFNVADLTSAPGTISIIILIIVLIASIKLFFNKKTNFKIWEIVLFSIVAVFLLLLAIYHYYDLIASVINANSDTYLQMLIRCITEIAIIVFATGFCTIWYFTYYSRIKQKRISIDPNSQKMLDLEFEPTPFIV